MRNVAGNLRSARLKNYRLDFSHFQTASGSTVFRLYSKSVQRGPLHKDNAMLSQQPQPKPTRIQNYVNNHLKFGLLLCCLVPIKTDLCHYIEVVLW